MQVQSGGDYPRELFEELVQGWHFDGISLDWFIQIFDGLDPSLGDSSELFRFYDLPLIEELDQLRDVDAGVDDFFSCLLERIEFQKGKGRFDNRFEI